MSEYCAGKQVQSDECCYVTLALMGEYRCKVFR